MVNENSREYKLAKEVERGINDYGFDNKKFAETLGTFHKTLESNFTRLLVECIRYLAADNRYIDARNRNSQRVAKILNQALEDNKDEIYLPYI